MIKQLLICSVVIFAAILLLLYVLQRHLIYLPSTQTPTLAAYQANDMHWVPLHTKDGLDLRAWYKPAAHQHPTLLYLHGNAGHIGYRIPLARQFIDAGFGVLMLEYRGYGGNAGHPSEQGLYEDGRSGVKFLQQQGVQAKQLVLYGESLGTGVATQLAIEFPVCAVVLQSPFTSLHEVAKYHYPWIFIKPWDHFDSLGRIDAIHAPLLILHGEKDQVVPYTQGLSLFERAREPKKMINFPEADHNNMWGDKQFAPDVIDFIQANCF